MRRVILLGVILGTWGLAAGMASGGMPKLAREAEFRKGDALVMRQMYEEALAIWGELEATYPEDPQVLMRVGVTQSMLENYEESERAFSRALELAPKDATIVYNHALMKLRKGDEAAAESYLRETLELFPSFPGANYHLGLIAERHGDKEAAKEFYVKEMNENPNQPQAWQRYFLLRNEVKKGERKGDRWIIYIAVGCALASVLLMSIERKPRPRQDEQT